MAMAKALPTTCPKYVVLGSVGGFNLRPRQGDGAQEGVPWAVRCPGTAGLAARPPRSPAGDVAHHGDAKLGFQVDAVGDAGGDDDLWGRLG